MLVGVGVGASVGTGVAVSVGTGVAVSVGAGVAMSLGVETGVPVGDGVGQDVPPVVTDPSVVQSSANAAGAPNSPMAVTRAEAARIATRRVSPRRVRLEGSSDDVIATLFIGRFGSATTSLAPAPPAHNGRTRTCGQLPCWLR